MQDSSSNLLIISPNPPAVFKDFGVEQINDPLLAEEIFKAGQCKILCVDNIQQNFDYHSLVGSFKEKVKNGVVVLFDDKLEKPKLVKLINSKNFLSIWSNFEHAQQALIEALQESDRIQQSNDLVELFQTQNQKLKELNKDLEKRVRRRQSYLKRSHKKLQLLNHQIETLHAALIATYQSHSVSEIESQIFKVLQKGIGNDLVKITFGEQTSLSQALQKQENFHSLALPLDIKGHPAAQLIVARKEQPYKEHERTTLDTLTETLSLAVERQLKFQDIEILKQQWEATFDSIKTPICLTGKDQKIIRTNLAFAKACNGEFKDLIGKNIFESFGTKHWQKYRLLNDEAVHFEVDQHEGERVRLRYLVSSYPIKVKSNNESLNVVFFKNITEKRRLEQQILQSAKMAELGVIGSSIAHELNNPIGGMLSFLQLIEMDINQGSSLAEDIREMIKATLKCKDIVENLLGFARKQDLEARVRIDLKDVLRQAVKISEIQSRAQGVPIVLHFDESPAPFDGQINLLTQAVCNLLHNAHEAIMKKKTQTEKSAGRIDLSLIQEGQKYMILIKDNGIGIRRSELPRVINPLYSTKDTSTQSGLGLTAAYNIISDHGGELEISSDFGKGTQATITLKRPESGASSQVFDGKI